MLVFQPTLCGAGRRGSGSSPENDLRRGGFSAPARPVCLMMTDFPFMAPVPVVLDGLEALPVVTVLVPMTKVCPIMESRSSLVVMVETDGSLVVLGREHD